MGWRFDLKYANIVAYVTLPQQKAPRLTQWQLREFLGSVQGEYRQTPSLISADRNWIEAVVHAARRASRVLESRRSDEDSFLDPEVVSSTLADLRDLLSRFELFGMTIGTSDDQNRLNAFAEHAAFSSGHHALFLIPDLPYPGQTLQMLDPLPVTRTIAVRPDLWPGMLFWLKDGSSAFACLEDAYGLYQRLLDGLRWGKRRAADILDEFSRRSDESGIRRILHLSDLHFGSFNAAQNQAYLMAHLRGQVSKVGRVVITGDLFDNPKAEDALIFRNFRAALLDATGLDPIVIPGNHDQKIKGNTFWGLGRKLRELTKLEWSCLVPDDNLQCVFYCFDSSRDAANFAQGKVTPEQMMEVATEFETRAAVRPELRDYLSIALVHHHPYSFNSRTETRIQRAFAAVHLKEEDFLKMENAEAFLSWCVGRRIPLILHGHKHVARHVFDKIEWTHGKQREWREVTAVGCGTSLGVEGLPLSYNILEWSPSSRKWSVAFFADPGFGTGFEEQSVALHSADA